MPFTFKVFNSFYDGGYAFSKVIAIAAVSYGVWLAGELKVLPFSASGVWVLAVIFAALNLFLMRNFLKQFLDSVRKRNKIIIFEEAVFFIILLASSLIRAYEPRIEGLEKFMDFGFINSILRAEYFPPKDMWLAGESINYYYFGHLVAAVLTKMSGISPYISYNLMVATVFSLVFISSFSLSSNLVHSYLNGPGALLNKFFGGKKFYVAAGGLISATVLTLGSNLQPLYYYLTHNFSFENYWYFDASRFIPNTIHEFPFFSFVISDLHGHYSDLPFVMLFIALVFILFKDYSETKLKPEESAQQRSVKAGILGGYFLRKDHFLMLFFGFVLAVIFMTNLSDWIIYAIFLSFAVICLNYSLYGFCRKFLINAFVMAGVPLVSSFIFALPFYLDFRSFTGGIAFTEFHSTVLQLSVVWGFYFFVIASFLIPLYYAFKKQNDPAEIKSGFQNYKFIKWVNSADYFALILIIVAAILIVLPEIVYIKDIYGKENQRLNTMFKLSYQAWILLGLVTGYVFVRWITSIKKRFLAVWLFLFVIFTGSILIYPKFAINSYYGELKKYKGLSGLDWMKNLYPEDYEAINWINKNVDGEHVIVEAVNGDYSHYGRISTNTGLVNIVNWPVHEWLWRGSYDEAGKRKEDVRIIYESDNMPNTKELLNKYGADYIFVGYLERNHYQSLNEDKLKDLGQEIFSSGQTKIYKIGR